MVAFATWNVENLFSPGRESGVDPRDYRAKLSGLVERITAAEPDVVALQEVGDEAALADLTDRLGRRWTSRVSTAPDSRGIRVAFVSRLPLGEARDVVDVPAPLAGARVEDDGTVLTRMGRGALRVEVAVGHGRYTLITCHLKSKLLSYPGGRFAPRDEDQRARYAAYALNRRAAEAATVRIEANAALAGQGNRRRCLVLGDLNDTELAATTQLLSGPGGSEIGTPGADRPDSGDGWRLWNTAPLIPAERRYSRVYRGRRELLDHVLVSRAVLRRVVGVDSLVEPALPSVTDDPRRRPPAAASDHALVICRLAD